MDKIIDQSFPIKFNAKTIFLFSLIDEGDLYFKYLSLSLLPMARNLRDDITRSMRKLYELPLKYFQRIKENYWNNSP